MAIIKHKQGDTFDKTCRWLNDFGNPIDLTAGLITVVSQIRHPIENELVQSLAVTYPTATSYKLLATAAQTQLWPVDRLAWDIEYHQGGVIISTETVFIDVIQDVTKL